jgi:hypothetical protein
MYQRSKITVTAAIRVEYKLGMANLKKILVKGNSINSFE